MTMLPALPASLRAYVLVVLHLPRDRPSLLVEIFGRRCALPVHEARLGEPLEPGTVTFAPPDYHLLVDRGPRASLSMDEPVHYSRPSIDVLFESAADVFGPGLIGVLLSGANADGAQGLSAVAREGGLTLVQSPDSALVATMPQAAMACMTPHHVAPPDVLATIISDLHSRNVL